MQHWLNMQLARQQGIAMNLHFPLPVRFLWDTARVLLGSDNVPAQSPYRREVLMWRIDALLQSDAFLQTDQASVVSRYWHTPEGREAQASQRLQFATALADVYEQYLMYRPDWLAAWEANQTVLTDQPHEAWQALIWRLLVAQQPLHPADLLKQALTALAQGQNVAALPQRIIVFAINTMAPSMVQFFDALAEYCDIHIFHLNPSVNYWGEAKSDKERARQLRAQGIARWCEQEQDNPFLGNLGKQGRDLFNLLTALDSFEVSAFDTAPPDEPEHASRLLTFIQQDILHASSPSGGQTLAEKDDSVSIVKAHSSLREVQGLHDFLLGIMQRNPTIRPSDIVVMCPAIEQYAPLIDATFQRVGTPLQSDSPVPRIPCSIADRSVLDAEPLIAAFLDLLTLPDSRFEVSKIMDYLRLEALQAKFGLSSDDLALMQHWLGQAHIHWGINAHHKAAITDTAVNDERYSWQWGLERLLVGMACADQEVLYDNLLTLPDVEGQQSVVLGKLMQLLEQLAHYAGQLKQWRSAEDWRDYLQLLRDSCFSPTRADTDSWESIGRALADLAAQCEEAGYEGELSLQQIREVLLKRFSSPDAGNHFMTGQVTFCSMLPMRSIPFKVVCILGLNDGEFPRQSQPISIDLMAQTARRLGDRSRRLEDRYLFLEALISARQHFYLSYQANSEQDNSERQPSLVLAEFVSVLEQGYGWHESRARQLALHPFSTGAFVPSAPSFEAGWFRLAQTLASEQKPADTDYVKLDNVNLPAACTVEQWARAFSDPLATFANQQLGVYLDEMAPLLNDAEPFVEDALTRYQVLWGLTDASLTSQNTHAVVERYLLSGDLPQNPVSDEKVTRWQDAVEALVGKIGLRDAEPHEVRWQGKNQTLTASLWQGANTLKLWHTGSQSGRRMMAQWFSLLCANALGNEQSLECFYIAWKRGEHEIRKARFTALPANEAEALLTEYEAVFATILSQPYPCYWEAANGLLKSAGDVLLPEWQHTDEANREWQRIVAGNSFQKGLIDNAYVRWFYPQGLGLDKVPLSTMDALFRPLKAALKDSKA